MVTPLLSFCFIVINSIVVVADIKLNLATVYDKKKIMKFGYYIRDQIA